MAIQFRKLLGVALGITTSVGGFLEAGSIATAAQAGAEFGYRLIWPIVLGTVLLVFLIEMAGRLGAVSGHPLPAAVRERFGASFFLVPLAAELLLDWLVLGSEIGGASFGLQILTGVSFRWFALPIVLLAWIILWQGKFGIIEYGVSGLGLITIAFVIAAFKLHPQWGHAARGILPSLPDSKGASYWFLFVSIVGATISPYLFNFYSSGAVEEKWTQHDLDENWFTAIFGMGFGGIMSVAVLICAACVFHPRHTSPQSFDQMAQTLSAPLGQAGRYLFGAALFIACFGASLEVSLDAAYITGQGFGWNWGANKTPQEAPRFALVYTLLFPLAAIFTFIGVDPMKLTIFSMAVTTLILPLVILPFLVLLNDRHYMKDHGNGRWANLIVFVAIVLAGILALCVIPLQIFGGSDS